MTNNSNNKSGSAKKQKTGPSPKGGKKMPQKGQGTARSGPTAKEAKKPAYEWVPFTKKSVDFNAAARDLATYLEVTYGQGVSITQYQKFLVHYATAEAREKATLHVEQVGIQLAMTYETAKDSRDAERNSFRSDIAVIDVQGTLASLLSTIQGPSGPKRGNEDMEEAEEASEEEK